MHPTTGQILGGHVMLSVAFDSEDFPTRPTFIEAQGWDSFCDRYKYYWRLDEAGGLLLFRSR